MGAPAVVQGDQIISICNGHQMIGPTGTPVPSPPIPFAAPLSLALAPTVLVEGKPPAVTGSSGYNQPPHVGLHASDPFMAPPLQVGQVMVGSSTVLFDGQPAAYSGCTVTGCFSLPANVVGSAVTVLIGA